MPIRSDLVNSLKIQQDNSRYLFWTKYKEIRMLFCVTSDVCYSCVFSSQFPLNGKETDILERREAKHWSGWMEQPVPRTVAFVTAPTSPWRLGLVFPFSCPPPQSQPHNIYFYFHPGVSVRKDFLFVSLSPKHTRAPINVSTPYY